MQKGDFCSKDCICLSVPYKIANNISIKKELKIGSLKEETEDLVDTIKMDVT